MENFFEWVDLKYGKTHVLILNWSETKLHLYICLHNQYFICISIPSSGVYCFARTLVKFPRLWFPVELWGVAPFTLSVSIIRWLLFRLKDGFKYDGPLRFWLWPKIPGNILLIRIRRDGRQAQTTAVAISMHDQWNASTLSPNIIREGEWFCVKRKHSQVASV